MCAALQLRDAELQGAPSPHDDATSSDTDTQTGGASPRAPELGAASSDSEGGSKPEGTGPDQLRLERLAVQLASDASGTDLPPSIVLSSSSSFGESPAKLGTLRACRGCQRAKTACHATQRPCPRCVRLKVRPLPLPPSLPNPSADMVRVCALQIPCESDQPPVKTACTNCRRAKVKCIFESGVACTRCSRLNLECLPHVPTKRKRLCPAERAAASGGQSPECASSKRPFLGNRDGPAMSLDRSQLQQNDMRAALEALAKGDAQRCSHGEAPLSPPGPRALSAVLTLMSVRHAA